MVTEIKNYYKVLNNVKIDGKGYLRGTIISTGKGRALMHRLAGLSVLYLNGRQVAQVKDAGRDIIDIDEGQAKAKNEVKIIEPKVLPKVEPKVDNKKKDIKKKGGK